MQDLQEQIDAQAREIVERKKNHWTSTGYLEGIEYGEERERFRVITLLNNAGWSFEKILEVLELPSSDYNKYKFMLLTM
ncbi:MAG: hypothetical protein ACFN1I_09815 [Selenomonas artemidis]